MKNEKLNSTPEVPEASPTEASNNFIQSEINRFASKWFTWATVGLGVVTVGALATGNPEVAHSTGALAVTHAVAAAVFIRKSLNDKRLRNSQANDENVSKNEGRGRNNQN